LIERYEAPPEIRRTSERISLEIIDDIFADAMGMHYLKPEVD